MEGALQCVTHILAVRDNMKTGLGSLNGLENCSDLASLSRLGRPHDRAVSRFADVCGNAPTRARAALGGAATPISRDHGDAV